MKPIIIIGSGLAGYGVARELRKLDKLMPLLIVTRDHGDAYYKPALSAALSQDKSPEDLITANVNKASQDFNATILYQTTVRNIDTALKLVVTDKGSFEYQSLVLALGAEVIRLKLEGDGADDVISVNDLWDYKRFREALLGAERIAILGSGLIGCEFASDLIGKGFKADVIGMTEQPLMPLIPAAAGEVLNKRFSEKGVSWHLERKVTSVMRSTSTSEKALNVILDNGDVINADIVLSAVGLRARTTLAAEAGITVNRGIVVDDYLRTSAADVYALGDCIEINGQTLPYVLPIMHASRVIAKTLAGQPTPVVFPPMPVTIKTQGYPILVLPAPMGVAGEWKLLEDDNGLKMGFVDQENKLLGFVLTEGQITQQAAMVAQLGHSLE
ncbi:MAG: FAD-dependent oxidoreductase [Methylophilaceae bacterium]|nr:FAD-dependent oxidoreductase [Methylophilaceae bacterium]